MGATLSRLPLTCFELLNELYIAASTGVLGLGILINHGIRTNHYFATLMVTSITTASLVYVFNTHEMAKATINKIVVITGCDSGLGYSMALHIGELGFTVLAGCYSLDSAGATKLMTRCGNDQIRVFQIDITDDISVSRAVNVTSQILKEHEDNVLWAIINNSGIMVFGEFEWQTDRQINEQISVNLMGTMRVTHAFSPLLRQYQGRIINISSHCALAALPGLAPYGATKAAIKAFTDALRIEMRKYDVKVISLIPGSFSNQSNILARQMEHVYEMQSAFTKEQDDFYGDYFAKYNAYLSAIALAKTPKKIVETDLYENIEHAILSKTPKAAYIVEPLRYTFYHTLFKITPTRIRDYLVENFMQMPKYKSPTRSTDVC